MYILIEATLLIHLKYSVIPNIAVNIYISTTYRFSVISAMLRSETPTFPYRKNGTSMHRAPPWDQVLVQKPDMANGSTIAQNRKSATHKLEFKFGYIESRSDVLKIFD
jgi:hypothetical protein